MKRTAMIVGLCTAFLGGCDGSDSISSLGSLPGGVADTGATISGTDGIGEEIPADEGVGGVPDGTFEGQPASLACRAPDFTPDQGPFVNLDLTAFDIYQQRAEAAIELPEASVATLQVALVSLVNSDVAFGSVYCNYGLFESTGCASSAIGGVTVDPVSLVGDQLSFTMAFADDPVTFEHIIDNRDYDSGSIRVTDAGTGKVDLLEWSRDVDGTERFDRNVAGSKLITYSWVENPDCSGSAQITETSDTTVEFSSDLSWTSPRSTDFAFEFTNCSTLEGGNQCASGSL